MPETEIEKPETEKDEDKKHEPKEGSPRWNEIYADAKEGKRKTAELTKKLEEQTLQIASFQQHNSNLQEAVDNLATKVSETDRPDPTINPEEYEVWLTEKIEAKLIKKVDTPNTPAPEVKTSPEVSSTLQTQITVQKGLHPDYVEVINEVEKEMSKNKYLAAEINGNEDPAKEAYAYGIKRREKIKVQKDQNREQGHVETGSYPVGKSGRSLTSAQIQAAKNIGVDPEKYAKQLIAIEDAKGRR